MLVPSLDLTCCTVGPFSVPRSRASAGDEDAARSFFFVLRALQLAPSAGAVVGDDLFEHGGQGGGVERFPLTKGDGSGGLVVVAGGDDAFGVGHDRAVVEEQVDVVLGGEQRADVSLEYEVGLHGALDRLGQLRVGSVDQVAQTLAKLPLPWWQRVDVVT